MPQVSLLHTPCHQQTDRQERPERNRRLTCQLTSGQLQDSGAGQRGERGNHHKHGNARDSDPNSGGRQEFDVAESEALDFSCGEIQPSQEPEYGSDGRALVCGLQAGRCTADDHGLRQSETGDRQIQPIWNDSAVDITPGKQAAQQTEQTKVADRGDQPRTQSALTTNGSSYFFPSVAAKP